jgi:DNA processing protein
VEVLLRLPGNIARWVKMYTFLGRSTVVEAGGLSVAFAVLSYAHVVIFIFYKSRIIRVNEGSFMILTDDKRHVMPVDMKEKFDIIRLSYARKISCINVIRYLEECDFDARATVGMIREKYADRVIFPNDDEIEEEETKNSKLGIQTITFKDSDYPIYLRYINTFPLILHCRGNLKLLSNKNIISLVGSRESPVNDIEFAKRIAKELGECKYIIASGMALGIDASVHFGSLKTGTIAILGSGVDYIYTKENKRLYNSIIYNGGIIISDFKLGTAPFSSNFIQRNRIIAGIGKGVVVINAGDRSGALSTANLAASFGRDVMVFPGNPYDEAKKGTNKLIQGGAILVTRTKDIVENIELYLTDTGIFREEKKNIRKTLGNIFPNNDAKKEKNRKNMTVDEIMLSKLNHTPIDIDAFIDNCEKDERLKVALGTFTTQIARLKLQDEVIIYDGKISLKIDKKYCL